MIKSIGYKCSFCKKVFVGGVDLSGREEFADHLLNNECSSFRDKFFRVVINNS